MTRRSDNQRLAARDLTKALGGQWRGTYGMARCPIHQDKNPSLKVRDDPTKSDGIDVHCFGGCDWRSVKEALRKHGLLSPLSATSRVPRRAIGSPRLQAADPSNTGNYRAARQIWQSARPITGTPAAAYLCGRGIRIALPCSLRYVPALRHSLYFLHFPALVASIADVDGCFLGVHRTFLVPVGNGLYRKAPLNPAKMMLGATKGGSVHLSQPTRIIAICEGIETGLSVAQACPELPTWAALSAGGIETLVLPPLPLAAEVIVAADHDPRGREAAENAAARWHKEGRKVRIALPPQANADFNDLLRANTTGVELVE